MSRWRIAEGEEARLTPEGPAAAVILSQGFLPLRVRSAAAGVHHRPEFPGSAVSLGDARYEVVAETIDGGQVVYQLEPWREGIVLRDQVVYGRELVRAAQAERRRLAERERARPWAWLLSPLFGLLPEPRQIRLCDRYGLDPAQATLSSGALEALLAFVLLRAAGGGWASVFSAVPGAAGPLGPLGLLLPLAPLSVVMGSIRAFGAIVFRDVAGAWFANAGEAVLDAWRTRPRRFDPTIMPMTREAFWARLAIPDRQQREPDGALLVRGALPHLSWAGGRLRVGEDLWLVETLPPRDERGRLVHAYRLRSPADPEAPAPQPPALDHYQEEVLAEVAREWRDVFEAGGRYVASLLPARVQRRALGRDAARGLRAPTVVTIVATLACALWFGTGAGFMNHLTGLVLLADALVRLWRVVRGDPAPSLLGFFGDWLRPERVAYHAHRDAERSILLAMR